MISILKLKWQSKTISSLASPPPKKNTSWFTQFISILEGFLFVSAKVKGRAIYIQYIGWSKYYVQCTCTSTQSVNKTGITIKGT